MEDGNVTGLEPATIFPNSKRFERERNRIIMLRLGEKYRSEINLSVHLDKREIRSAKVDIGRIQGKEKPIILQGANPRFFTHLT